MPTAADSDVIEGGMSEEKIERNVLREVDKLFPGFSDTLLFSRVYRWEHGAVQLPPGALAGQAAARETIEKEFRDIFFAGDGFNVAGLEVSHNTGIRAAEKILEAVSRRG